MAGAGGDGRDDRQPVTDGDPVHDGGGPHGDAVTPAAGGWSGAVPNRGEFAVEDGRDISGYGETHYGSPATWPVVGPLPTHDDRTRSRLPVPPTILAVVWALVPMVSLGFLSAPCVLVAAIRLRSHRLAVWTGIYLGLTIVAIALSSFPDDSWESGAGSSVIICTGLVATMHCFAVLGEVVAPERHPRNDWRAFLS